MARKSKTEKSPVQKLPVNLAATERQEVQDPLSSGDTIAIDYDVPMEDAAINDHDNEKTSKF